MTKKASPSEELLKEMKFHITKLLCLKGMEKKGALKLSEDILDLFCTHCGGQMIYFPKATYQKARDRAKQIYTEFNGSNKKEICQKYGITEVWLYQIIKSVSKKSDKLATDRK